MLKSKLLQLALFAGFVLFILQGSTMLQADFQSVKITGIPHVLQKPDFCGEACAEMYLKKLGYRLDQDDVFDHSGLSPLLARGCYTRDLVKALRNIGFQTGACWYSVNPNQAPRDLNREFAELHKDLKKGVPSILCMHYDSSPNTTEHFRLVTGYNAQTDEIIYQEPARKNGAEQRMSRKKLYALWPLKYQAEKWTVVRIPLHASKVKNITRQQKFTDADFAQHMMQLRKKIPGKEYSILIRKPFVVIGNEEADTVEQRADRTVSWAVRMLKQDYFTKDPKAIIDIWLFKDKVSYRKQTKAIFNDNPSTPYGYYSPKHQALMMNIATGGGTLVHEIVHPFIASNFPRCPSWFNEGLASLYEQCGTEQGHIHGYTNWRLGGLKQAIRAKSVPKFKTLCSTTTDQFYNKDRGTNYSQARYLCYYLQQQGKLVKYYNLFRKHVKTDPTGYASLQQVLGTTEMDTFQTDWEAWIMKLK